MSEGRPATDALADGKLLARELWTSWASCLRSYAAVYGLSSAHHAVVEVSDEEIVLRADTRSIRFTPAVYAAGSGPALPFRLHEDGTVTLADRTEEMDLAAERVARALFDLA